MILNWIVAVVTWTWNVSENGKPSWWERRKREGERRKEGERRGVGNNNKKSSVHSAIAASPPHNPYLLGELEYLIFLEDRDFE